MDKLFSLGWTTYVLIGLVLAVLSLGFLYKKEIEHTGQLTAKNEQLNDSIGQLSKEKDQLNATVEANAKISADEALERQKLQEQTQALSKQVASLKRYTKPKVVSNVQDNNALSDDIDLSPELTSLLKQASCNTNPKLCPSPSKPSN